MDNSAREGSRAASPCFHRPEEGALPVPAEVSKSLAFPCFACGEDREIWIYA